MNEIKLPARMASEPDAGIVEMLLDTKANLWRGDTPKPLPSWKEYICLAGDSGTRALQAKLEDEINRRLAAYREPGTAAVYMNFRVYVDDAYPNNEFDAATVQAARLRWIDQLVEEFSPKN